MTRFQEWQKELVGLGVGATVINAVILVALVVMFLLATSHFLN